MAKLKIDLTEELQRAVEKRVRDGGFQDEADYVRALIRVDVQRFHSNANSEDEMNLDEFVPLGSETKITNAEVFTRLRELRKGVTLGPDLTIKELIEEGRRY